MSMVNIIIAISVITFFSSLAYLAYMQYNHRKWLNIVFDIEDDLGISEAVLEKKADFLLKLHKAGMDQKAYIEIVSASAIAGISLIALLFVIEFSLMVKIAITMIAIFIIIFMPKIYIDEQIKARIERIDADLAIFLDLLIIILESGGGLNNAIDQVTIDAKDVLGKDLLEESKRFKNEMIASSSQRAYDGLINRTGSKSIATIVGFMRLSEETGIGLKSVFENQANEIKNEAFKLLEKKAATLNLKITLIVFLFILPALIAMMAFPLVFGNVMASF